MAQKQSKRLRHGLLLCTLCIMVYFVVFPRRDSWTFPSPTAISPSLGGEPHLRPEEYTNLFMTEAQCIRTFPRLTAEIGSAVAFGPFDLPIRSGALTQLKIQDGNLRVLRYPAKDNLAAVMHHRHSATLQQIHRALITSPAPLPNTSLAFSTHDQPLEDTCSYARPAFSPSHKRFFPMPHFSFWSWPLPFINSLPAAQEAIALIEAGFDSFAQKDPRAVWRGTNWYNNGASANPRLRMDLVAKAENKPWADVEALKWETNQVDAKNALRIEDFCNYKYIIQTEGMGYSGRLQFHQLCESVILSPPLEWIQHTSHLIKPVFSAAMRAPGSRAKISENLRKAWPAEHSVDEANMVFVSSDWSDLEETVAWLEDHPDVAAGIARRQRKLYAEGGYLSPAAEVCYWRALIRGWSEVARPVGEEWSEEGVPFEEFITGKQNGT